MLKVSSLTLWHCWYQTWMKKLTIKFELENSSKKTKYNICTHLECLEMINKAICCPSHHRGEADGALAFVLESLN